MAARSEIWTSQLNRDHYTFLLQPCAARESADMIAAEECLSMFSHQVMLLPATRVTKKAVHRRKAGTPPRLAAQLCMANTAKINA